MTNPRHIPRRAFDYFAGLHSFSADNPSLFQVYYETRDGRAAGWYWLPLASATTAPPRGPFTSSRRAYDAARDKAE